MEVNWSIRAVVAAAIVLGLAGCGETTTETIAKWKAAGNVPKLVDALGSPHQDVRLAAIKAVADLKAEAAVAPLAGMLNDEDQLVVHKSIDAIAAIGGNAAKAEMMELLNYETNEAKLLQIVIFAQTEFESVLADRENLADRINLFHRLGPLGFLDTRRMIQYRLNQAGSSPDSQPLFSLPGLWAVYRATGGYPRKIIHLCHKSVLAAIIQNRKRAGWFLVRACARRNYSRFQRRPARKLAWAATALIAAGVVMAGYGIDLSPWLGSLSGQGHPSPPAPTLRATGAGNDENIVQKAQHSPAVPVAAHRPVVPLLEPARPIPSDSVAALP